MSKKTIRDIDWHGKCAFVRADFNVPFVHGSGVISDDTRIQEAIPTIEYLLENGASIILCSHLGRPNGRIDEDLRLKPIAERLATLLDKEIRYTSDEENQTLNISSIRQGEVVLLENIRFSPQEETNDGPFAMSLAKMADVFVNDAFGTAHRAHASTEGIAHHVTAVAGLLMEKELSFLGAVLNDPKRPLAALFGGAKVSDKIQILDRLLGHADNILVGGGMAATFLHAQGYNVGASLLENEMVDFCVNLLNKAHEVGTHIHLPVDVLTADKIEANVETTIANVTDIPASSMILDIGPATANNYVRILSSMNTVVWNGPMGVFEVPPFDTGTKEIANHLSMSHAVTVIGGGSTSEAVTHLGLETYMSHVSTGGGASLEFLEGKVLPGVAALDDI